MTHDPEHALSPVRMLELKKACAEKASKHWQSLVCVGFFVCLMMLGAGLGKMALACIFGVSQVTGKDAILGAALGGAIGGAIGSIPWSLAHRRLTKRYLDEELAKIRQSNNPT